MASLSLTIKTRGSSVQTLWWSFISVQVKNSAQHFSQTCVSSPQAPPPLASSPSELSSRPENYTMTNQLQRFVSFLC